MWPIRRWVNEAELGASLFGFFMSTTNQKPVALRTRERPLRITVKESSIRIDYFSRTTPKGRIVLKIPFSQFADMVAGAQSGYMKTGPEQFLLGFTDELLELHGMKPEKEAMVR